MKKKLSDFIKVTYDGAYPNTCSGTLKIFIEGVEVYSNDYCTNSTGCVSFTAEWDEIITEGVLEWIPEPEDVRGFICEAIREAVAEELSKFHVCCGGCV